MQVHTVSIRAKSPNERCNTSFKMGVGNDLSENRESKLHSNTRGQRQLSISPRNRHELFETAADTATTVQQRQSPNTNLKANNSSASFSSLSDSHMNESVSSQSSFTTEDRSVATTSAITTAKSATTIDATVADQQSKVQTARRERRPDRAVYIPRARRSQTTPPTTTAAATTVTTITTNIATNTNTVMCGSVASTNTIINSSSNGLSGGGCGSGSTSSSSSLNHQKTHSIVLGANANEPAVGTITLSKIDETSKKKSKTGNNSNNSAIGNVGTVGTGTGAGPNHTKERRHSERHHRKSIEKLKSNSQKELEYKTSSSRTREQDCDKQQQQQEYNHYQHQQQTVTTVSDTNQMPIGASKRTDITVSTATNDEMNSTKINKIIKRSPVCAAVAAIPPAASQNGIDVAAKVTLPPLSKGTHMLIEDMASDEQKNSSSATKCDIDVQELRRASKEINRSNRRIIKQTFVSDVLEIPDKIEQVYDNPKPNAIKVAIPSPSKNFDSTTEDEEDDWESKYDESGDCLDPRMLEELESAVGKVKITTPKTDYSAFLSNQAILNDEEFPHVLEVSNFPVEFKNQDLLMVFSQYKESGFDIKWVDDTHALAVFSSSRIAAEVLTMGHPFVVLKPLAEATLESRLKAKKCASSLQPYRQRPETCAALARRLVTGALGVRLETAAAERENEKRVLRKAKERKLLAAKQRDEAWES